LTVAEAHQIVVYEQDQTALTDREIDTFHEVGWISRPALFRRDEVSRMRKCFDRLEWLASGMRETGLNKGSHFVLGEKNGARIVKRVVWAGGSQPYLLQIGADPRLTVPSSQLLGSNDMDQLLSQAHFKRPGDGVIFGWHQDIQHRDKGNGTWQDVNGKGSFVQTLIVVDEMTPDSGPIQFMPGSSRWGRVDFGDHDYDDTGYTPKRPPQFRDDEAVTVTAQPGDTLFFGPYTAHASFENTSRQYRRVFINGYAFPGANSRVYPGEGSCRRITVSSSG
jgi:ectoine hydroxylase-related dioxygenase (phytanoyl-CoA dioxygenase family)